MTVRGRKLKKKKTNDEIISKNTPTASLQRDKTPLQRVS